MSVSTAVTVTFTCDVCGNEVLLPAGAAPSGMPDGWRRIADTTGAEIHVCSTDCLTKNAATVAKAALASKK